MKKMSKKAIAAMLAVILCVQLLCGFNGTDNINAAYDISQELISDIYTDKSLYNPGEVVLVNVELKNSSSDSLSGTVKIKGYHLNNRAGEDVSQAYTINSGESKTLTLEWKAPSEDFQGYLLEAYVYDANGQLLDTEAVGVNVSSSWVKFPIYGYVHDFGDGVDTDGKIAEMSKYHINGIEYYDWQYRHHEPLPSWSTTENPGTWEDWSGRYINGHTIKDYIAAAKEHNMVSMAYDMIYAGTDDFFKDNAVTNTWKLKHRYGDNAGQEFYFTMGDSPSGNGHLYFVNPLHTDWQNHLFGEVNRMIEVMGFDGYHGDTVGDWGDMTDYYGNPIGWDENGNGLYSVLDTYNPFLNACKASLADGKYLSFNPVGAKGIEGVNSSYTDILYTEFWPWDSSRHGITYNTYYAILKEVEDSMDDSKAVSFDGEGKSLSVKAYINYKCEGGYINEPTALLMEAVCFAAGGSRVELGNGEHMLTNEYYIDDNIPMREGLKADVRNMYDFAVAYENILRDGQSTTENIVELEGYAYSSEGASDTVWTYTRSDDTYQILHLINLLGTDNEWRDTERTKAEPEKAENFKVKYYYTGDVNSVYLASPDIDDCRSRSLEFIKGEDSKGRYVEFTVPSLEYWDMIYMTEATGENLTPDNPEMPSEEDIVRIEAEDFSGYSESGSISDNNSYVSGLQNDRITYTLPENFKSGKYEIKVRYISAVSADLNVSAGYETKSVGWNINCGSSWSWDTSYDLSCGTFNLAAGDTISLWATGESPYIQIDYVVLIKNGSYEFEGEQFRLEAEDGVLSQMGGFPAVGENTEASNGKYVHDIGKNQGYVTVEVPENVQSGIYTLKMLYSSSTNGAVSVAVGDTEYVVDYSMTNSDWSFEQGIISLSGVRLSGSEKIKVQDAEDNCYIWLDCIAAVLDEADEKNTCEVTFINDSEVYSVQTVDAGLTVNIPQAPSNTDSLFIGWFTKDIGTVLSVDNEILDYAFDVDKEINNDTTLYAGWLSVGTVAKDASDDSADFSNDSGFYLLGAQYREYIDANNIPGGVRFVARMSTSLISAVEALNPANEKLQPENSSDTGIGYGMVVTRASNLSESDMLVKDENAEYVINGMKVCPAVNTYRKYNDYLIYTAVVTGIREKYLDENIAARMYITYVDANGIEQTFYYTETESPNTIGGAYYTTYRKVFEASNM